ncbi:hypothetical protein Mgra_00003897 [Meloidogyne graminicola]|uniref:ANK_REP_REGION domain-containing protein n=1 Tax=Meloidogyne graminicola TaxID=189291 RepID=A0A8S9ZTX2_9BILA|nr:hypothetical protein Mgra_00003897 [Meloidogyne graminicola]
MVIDKELQIEEHAAMLQNKAIIHSNILEKRKESEQLRNWENSELNKICPKKKSSHLSKVKFQNNDIFLSACQSADEDELEELLNKGSDINCANIDGVTALHQSIIGDKI